MLRRARPRRVRPQRNFHNRARRRIRLQLQTQQFQKHFGIPHGHRQIQNLLIRFRHCRRFRFHSRHSRRRGCRVFPANRLLLLERIPQIKSHTNRRSAQRPRRQNACTPDPAIAPTRTLKAPDPPPHHPAPSLLPKFPPAQPTPAHAHAPRAPVPVNALLPAPIVPTIPAPATPPTPRTFVCPSAPAFPKLPRRARASAPATRSNTVLPPPLESR